MQPELHALVAAERLRDDHGVRPDDTPQPALKTALRPGEQVARVPPRLRRP